MIPWELLGSAQVPGTGGELRLYRRGREFSIRVNSSELMNSSAHSSEDAMAELACAKISGRVSPRILIGGLGMGYTLAAALRLLGPDAVVVVAELVPELVVWNRGPLADLAGHPLEDSRVEIRETDVACILRGERRSYDAILLDVDNGPEGLTRQENDWLYSRPGLDAAFTALRPAGVLAVWSAVPDPSFSRRLRQAGFRADQVRVRARGLHGGGRHTIWIAVRSF
jgi:spermidine synthase